MVYFANRIWLLGGHVDSPADEVFSYDPVNDTWRNEPKLSCHLLVYVLVAKDMIFLAGGSINLMKSKFTVQEQENGFCRKSTRVEIVADAVVLNNEVYIIGGGTNWILQIKFTPPILMLPLMGCMTSTAKMDVRWAPQFCSLNMRMDRSPQARWQMVQLPPIN